MKSITNRAVIIGMIAFAVATSSEYIAEPQDPDLHMQKHYSSNARAASPDPAREDGWCNVESEALASCAHEETLKCMTCSYRALLRIENDVFSESNVDSFLCEDLKNSGMRDDLLSCATEECPDDCAQELHDHHECLVRSTTGCDLDSSSGFKTDIMVVPALALLGTVVMGWM